jgi:hypothetical protein
VGRADLRGLEREGAVAALAIRGDEPRVEVLDGRLGVERDQRVLEGVGPDAGDDVRRDEAERVADVELAAPDLGHELRGGEAALAVGIREGRQAGLADEVGLGGSDGRDVQLAAPDHGDRDADRAGLLAVSHAVAVALVGEALVGDPQHLGQALADAGRLVVVVLVADRVGDHPGRLARAIARDPRGHEQVQVALRASDGADRWLDHHDRVGRVGDPVLLRDGAELQLESDGQAASLME